MVPTLLYILFSRELIVTKSHKCINLRHEFGGIVDFLQQVMGCTSLWLEG